MLSINTFGSLTKHRTNNSHTTHTPPMKRRTSYLQNELERLSNELQLVFSDIGFSHAEKEEKERLHFAKLVEALQVRLLEEKSYRDELKQKCVDKQIRLKVLKTTSLPDVSGGSSAGLVAVIDEPIFPPYKELLERLDRSGSKLEQVFHERSDLVRQFQKELDRYDELMGPEKEATTRVDLDGSVPPRLTMDVLKDVEGCFERRKEEFEARQAQIEVLASSINEHWTLLGVENEELDDTIIQHRSVPLALTNAKITYLQDTLKELQLLREERQQTIEKYRQEVEHLWNRLDENEGVIEQFLGTVAGETAQVVEKWHAEVLRMRHLKQDHLNVFIAEARENLSQIWDALYYSEEQRQQFVPFYMSEDSSEALLEVHEKEIAAREADLTEFESTLDLIKQHKQLVEDARQLEEASRDPARLLGKSQRGDPGRLLREEQTRKQIARKMPKIIVALKQALMDHEEASGSPFLVFGKSYLQEMQQTEVEQTPRRRAVNNGSRSVSREVPQSASRSVSREQPKPVSRAPPSATRSVSRPKNTFPGSTTSPTKSRAPRSVPRPVTRPMDRPVTVGNDIRSNLTSLRGGGRPATAESRARPTHTAPHTVESRVPPRAPHTVESRDRPVRILSAPRMQPLQSTNSNRINKPTTIPGPKRRSLNRKLTPAQVTHNLMGGDETPVRESTPKKVYPQELVGTPKVFQEVPSTPKVSVWERLSPKKEGESTPRRSPVRSPMRSPVRSPVKVQSPVNTFAVPKVTHVPETLEHATRSPKKYGQLDRYYTGPSPNEIRSVSGTSTFSTSSASIFSDVELVSSDEEDAEYAALMMQQRRQISRGLPKKRSDQPRLSVFNWDKDVF